MKILIIQEASRNKANYNLKESLVFHRAFLSIGVESVVWGLNYENFNIPFEEVSKNCDVLFLLENWEINNWIPDLSKYKGVKVFWSIDSHCNLENHLKICNKNKIDLVLNAIESDQKHFVDQKTFYFPNFYNNEFIKPLTGIDKKYDIGYCGNYTTKKRKKWINYLEKKINLKKDIMVLGEEMVKAVCSYKIHFNMNIANDINFRTFETLGCQTLLFTNYTENLNKLFIPDEHLIVYKNKRDLINKYKYFLENPDELYQIAQEGHNYVKNNHSLKHRVHQFQEIINSF